MTSGDEANDGDDDVIAEMNGGLLPLRNESTAPPLKVSASGKCYPAGATVTVTVTGNDLRTMGLRAAHTFAGAHAPSLVVGTNGRAVTLEIEFVGHPPTAAAVPARPGRQSSSTECMT